MDKYELLKKYWGYSNFYPSQEKIINALIDGKNAIGLIPTAGGKSLCYQITSLLLEGSTLVITPLIALMEDQVNQLLKIGIKAMYFESDSKNLSLDQQIENSIYGNYKLIFCSPERFLNSKFLNQFSKANISLLAIDEAHCISELGHDFRPSYRRLNIIKNLFPKAPLVALTASATKEVIKDIREVLELKQAYFFQDSFDRPNISYNVLDIKKKYKSLIKLMDIHKGACIIYCSTRKETEYLSIYLNRHNYKATFFHGGLSSVEKKNRLQAWQNGLISNIVATSAFGMGINKLNVRLIIHMQAPQSLENYYQETGRAGRDQKKAFCYLFFNQKDEIKLKEHFLFKIPQTNEILNIYSDLNNFFQIAYGEGKDKIYNLNLEEFCSRYKRNLFKVNYFLKLLEQKGILQLKTRKGNNLNVKILLPEKQILQYISKNTFESKLLEFLIRRKSDFFKDYTFISSHKIINSLKCSKERMILAFERLKKNEILNFTFLESSFFIKLIVPREDNFTLSSVIKLSEKIFQVKKKKFEKMLKFIHDSSICNRNKILSYFGENKKDNCMQCSSDSCNANHF